MFKQIFKSGAEKIGAIHESTQAMIAPWTQESPIDSRFMRVVNCKSFSIWKRTANRAASILRLKHRVVINESQAVVLAQPFISQSVVILLIIVAPITSGLSLSVINAHALFAIRSKAIRLLRHAMKVTSALCHLTSWAVLLFGNRYVVSTMKSVSLAGRCILAVLAMHRSIIGSLIEMWKVNYRLFDLAVFADSFWYDWLSRHALASYAMSVSARVSRLLKQAVDSLSIIPQKQFKFVSLCLQLEAIGSGFPFHTATQPLPPICVAM